MLRRIYKKSLMERQLLLLRAVASRIALRDDLAGILIQRTGLWQGFDGLGKLHVVLEVNLSAFGQAENGDESFLANFVLDPRKILRDVFFRIRNFFLVEI